MVDFNHDPYSFLSQQHRQELPTFQKARRLLSAFEDTTNSTWLLETADGLRVLKLCDVQWLNESVFWGGMRILFALQLPWQMQQQQHVYPLIAQLSPLQIPQLLAAGAASYDGQYPGFVLLSWLEGQTLSAGNVTETTVRDLARHLVQLHQAQRSSWGTFGHARFSAEQWPLRLRKTLSVLATKQGLQQPQVLQYALNQALLCRPQQFVPLMPDLRWDQFLAQGPQLKALVDLDAVVWGPRELDFVLLEYLLTGNQWQVFRDSYQTCLPLPDLKAVRQPYRLLLFLMNVLGETDCQQWMQAPTYL